MKEEIKHCSVVNCQKEVKDGEYKVINGKTFCLECATLYYKMLLTDLGYDPV
ncbi:MAG: hypothetical protein ACTSVY_11785 [Candidatus Helarchaeota archaeon]